jgi:UDP-N-acetylglucosamine 2-epimerase (non-hydrolysing)
MTIIGTRPEFVQIAPLTKALRKKHTEVLVNTGQHYDDNMSRVFFEDLGLPPPEVNLGVGSSSHAEQTGTIMMRLEPVMLAEKPDWVIVYGDTNSTLAGALTAAKLHIPIAHIEAGLRSFDRRMPEEINRILTDHMSDLLFAPTRKAVENLAAEGITQGVHQVGDVRVDLCHEIAGVAERRVSWLCFLAAGAVWVDARPALRAHNHPPRGQHRRPGPAAGYCFRAEPA